MTIAQELHRAHKERVARIHGAGKPEKTTKHEELDPKVRAKRVVVVTANEWNAIDALVEKMRALPSIATNISLLKKIRREVAKAHCLSEIELASKCRVQKVCEARFEYCYRAVTETTASLPKIGRYIERGHCAVIHAVATYCNQRNLPFPRGATWTKWRKATP